MAIDMLCLEDEGGVRAVTLDLSKRSLSILVICSIYMQHGNASQGAEKAKQLISYLWTPDGFRSYSTPESVILRQRVSFILMDPGDT
jgi:hypothetical protein